MGRDNLVSERAGVEYLGAGEMVFTTVGLLRIVRTLHIDIMKIRTYVLHLFEHGI